MAVGGSVTISGTITGLPIGSKVVGPYQIAPTGLVDQVTDITLVSGDNTITVPATATGCVIIPPPVNTVVLKIKGVGGDTGIVISKINPFILCFDTVPPASFIINAASLTAGNTAIEFF